MIHLLLLREKWFTIDISIAKKKHILAKSKKVSITELLIISIMYKMVGGEGLEPTVKGLWVLCFDH